MIRHFPINSSRADTIRTRFERNARVSRAQADEAEEVGCTAMADSLRRVAESQERMAAKRYEAMRVVGSL